jgi:hypothetical protein
MYLFLKNGSYKVDKSLVSDVRHLTIYNFTWEIIWYGE